MSSASPGRRQFREADESGDAVRILFGRGSIYMAAVAVQVGAGVVALPFLSRLVPPAEMGVISLALVVQAVLGVVAALGLPSAVMRNFFQTEGLAGARGIIAWTTLAAFPIVVIAALSVPLWGSGLGAENDIASLRIAAISAFAVAVLTTGQSLLRAQDRAGVYIVTAIVGTVGAQILGLCAVALFDGGTEAYLAGLTAGILAGATIALLAVGVRPADLRPAARMGKALRVGLPLVFHSLAIYLLAAGDRVVIAQIESLAAVGRYQVAYLIGALALTILAAANNTWTPIVFGTPEDRRWSVLAETADVLWRLIPFAVGVLALAAPIALTIAAPESYESADLTPVTAMVAFTAVPQLVYMGAFLPLYWAGEMGSLAWITPLAAAANLGLNLLLVPPFGLEGAAAATILSYGLMATLVWQRSRGLAEVPWPVATMLIGGAAAALLAGAGAAMPADGTWIALRTVATVGLLATAAMIVRTALRNRD